MTNPDIQKQAGMADLETAEKIWSHLYTASGESWLSYVNWLSEGVNLFLCLRDNNLAATFMPEPWFDHRVLRYLYNWGLRDLKKLLSSEHVTLIRKDCTEEQVNSSLDLMADSRSVFITVWNLTDNLLNVYEVTPGWEGISIPGRTTKELQWDVRKAILSRLEQ